MTLKSKQIYLPPVPEDGIRISIMSRHTLDDGVTPDSKIAQSLFHEHRPELAPPLKLIGDYYKRGLAWDLFSYRYEEYLGSSVASVAVECLSLLAMRQTVTVLCKEENPSQCHRSLLLVFCRRAYPGLVVEIQ